MNSTADLDGPEPSAPVGDEKKADASEPNGSPLPSAHEEKLPLSDSTPIKTPITETASSSTTSTGEDTPVAKVLHFLATATPGKLAGVALGFAAVTYLTLGRLGLVLIGAFGGVAGFISWEARNPEAAKAVRGEKGVDILERLYLDSKSRKAEENAEDDKEDEAAALKSFDDFRPETKDALGGLVDAVIKDYVKWWYSPIIPSDHSFPLACRKTLTSYILAISNHLSRKRPADAFLDLLTNSSSIVIVFMSELASAFHDLPPDSNMTAADAMYNYLASNPDCHLANLLNQRQQATKFKMVAEDLLGFLDKNSYNCDPARIFLREILANSVLELTLQRCSKADWINGWIVYLLESGEPDLNQAIDYGMQTGPDNNVFADMDGNVGNIGIAKPRSKDISGHKKKLSKAEEELDEAMEEMKRMNDMIVKEEEYRRKRASTLTEKSEQQAVSQGRESSESESQKRIANGVRSASASGPPGHKLLPSVTSTDGFSAKSDAATTPLTPRSPMDTSSPNSSPRRSEGARFTSFDQIVPEAQPEDTDEEAPKKAPLTLHNATITLHDDSTGDGGGRIRTKPGWDYWVQVEPAVTSYPGWMIVRRYSDFETLHEILRRIANISGATAFTELHKDLPSWKVHTRESLRGELERYLRDACWYQSLAESEGMKRFLEKSQGHTHGGSKSVFGWETVGKNMLDVLSTAPKGAMESGKTLVGGVTGVFGNIPGLSRKSTQSVDLTNLTTSSSRLSLSTPPRPESMSMRSPARSARDSLDSQRSSVISTQPTKMPPMERRPSYQSQCESEGDLRMGRSDRKDSASASASARPSREHSRAPSLAQLRSPSSASLEFIKLPPPPDQMADDYGSPNSGGDMQSKMNDSIQSQQHGRSASVPLTSPTPPAAVNGFKKIPLKGRQYSQLSESETRVAVELLFAVINEMYTLSSAWNIRRTLLTAAKSFLLRPGNPSLLTVQSIIQNNVLDANTSDAGIAAQLRKLRENTMPTEQELAGWPAELTPEESEKLKVKARKLLIRSGLPAALMGVMGQAATGDALGRVFDCLQIEEVARGLIFGLMLQGVRIVTH
ncbi:Fc.00g102580.m01.CDS01 [Cosmosporella sp. VM-42]